MRDVGLGDDNTSLPRALWLRLTDLRNKEIRSELVLFTRSYDVKI